jgi:TonB family protein
MKRITLCICIVLIYTVLFSQEYIEAHAIGGKHQVRYFIEQELVYPESSYSNGIEGKVYFLFDIDKNGKPVNIRDVQFPDSATYTEAQRIFNLIEWVPATLGGLPVVDMDHFEIDFNIKKYNRLCKMRGYKNILNPYEPIDSSGKIYWYRNLDEAPYPIFAERKQNLASFISENLKYPEQAIRQNLSGVVKLSFVVETNGKISNMEIVNSVGAGCNEEAIRILRLLKWMPGIYDQKAVRTRTSITISFSLDRGNDGHFNPVVKSSYGG